jgi:excisionase family DNA binding protein
MTTETHKTSLLSSVEVAKLLNIHPVTLRKSRSNGTLPLPFIRVGGSVRYREEDIHDFISSNTHGNEA